MNIRILTTTRALAVALGLIATGAFAESTTAMEDAAIEKDAIRGEPMQEVEVYGQE